jgi:hypothetical protein
MDPTPPRENLKVTSLRVTPALLANIGMSLNGLRGTNTLACFVRRKKFYAIDTLARDSLPNGTAQYSRPPNKGYLFC